MFPKISGMMLGGGVIAGLGFAWGHNPDGQLGDGTTVNKSSPIQVGTRQWVSQSFGGYHQALVALDGTLWTMGKNPDGQLGDGTTVNKSSPIQVGALTDWAKVYCGFNFTLALKKDGSLWGWGNNGSGQLGDGTSVSKSSPVQIGALTDWSGGKVAAGGNFWLAVKANGTLWSCGSNSAGQLGDGTLTARLSPIQVGALTNWKSPGTGYQTSMCVKTDGTLWGWGASATYQLWTGSGRSSPAQLGAGATWDIVGTGIRNTHFWAVKTDGTLWGWGENGAGQVGAGNVSPYRGSPVQIGALTDWSPPVTQIERRPAMGRKNSFAIKSNGSLWAVGQAPWLGDNTVVGKSSPVQIGALTNWLGVTAGQYTIGALSR